MSAPKPTSAARFWLPLMLAACGGQSPGDTRDTVHLGEPTARPRRAALDTTTLEIEFLQYLIEHEWAIGGLLRGADGKDLTSSTLAALKHAENHWYENGADFVAARRAYGGGRRSPAPPPREQGDGVEQFQGAEYERALLRKLASHYWEEVAAVDTVLPRLNAEPVRALAERIRQQRLQDIRDLTRGGSNDSVVPAD